MIILFLMSLDFSLLLDFLDWFLGLLKSAFESFLEDILKEAFFGLLISNNRGKREDS